MLETKVNKTQQTLRQYCEKNLSSFDFNHLHETLKTTKYKLTSTLNAPNKMPYDILIGLSKALGITPMSLVEQYEAGLDGMTAREYRKLLE